MTICFNVTSVACPLQLEGIINGRTFYFRARWDSIYCGISNDPYDEDNIFTLRETVQLYNSCASYQVSHQEALEFVKMAYKLSLHLP